MFHTPASSLALAVPNLICDPPRDPLFEHCGPDSPEWIGCAESVSADVLLVGHTHLLFVQEGRKVFREVIPLVSQMIVDHARDLGIDVASLKRLWLHQANLNMNELIARKVLGREPSAEENVIILDEFANTSSAGSIIAFHRANADLQAGDVGLICSFGAGYSAGTVFVRKR